MSTMTHAGIPPATTDNQSFLLKRIQPALSGLMDGSLSTLAPIFAVMLATHHPLTAFYTGAAIIVVAVELVTLAWLRHKFFQTSFARSFLAVAVGGMIIASLSGVLGVLAAG
ncbi:MAG: hypothetical protein ACRDOD_00100 [Streptosporangiaceae bacterium]